MAGAERSERLGEDGLQFSGEREGVTGLVDQMELATARQGGRQVVGD